MQSITIGKPHEYLRLTAVRWPSDSAPDYVPREKRRYLQAELRNHDVTANTRLDLWHDYAGLPQYFEQVVAHWPEWENSSMTWGLSSALRLELIHGPRPAGGPDHFSLRIKLQGGHGHRRNFWVLETSMVLSPEELETIARDIRELTD
ncbi:hypothetical protein EV645_5087 [Kribbella rubisoli]|uniref:Uncharacterized protein n=1 Tax=Kribbella rubisoli TaxID=3075929 RepID=A0A4Q7WV15_9ACTN|nr:DUF6228 family protein [Kribbella rubisoli]RZU14221.1 hypothetical protein EV645_5087 [Kribbella rubisoli]